MNRADLGGPLLASVSRSFYLSIRLLPAAVRAPIGLAYLLARTSDTIADSSSAPSSARLAHLAAFGQMVDAMEPHDLPALQREILPSDPAERRLIEQIEPCLRWLATLPAEDQREIREVLRQIVHGQALDLQRFPHADTEKVAALPTAEALEEYTYLVAGCVGEFWTRLCWRRVPGYARGGLEEAVRLGRGFGKGLQLVNILRDLPADLRQGRCYLPLDELAAVGVDPAGVLRAPEEVQPVYQRWWNKAQQYMEEGRLYIRAVRPARLRMGCFLPWHLGLKTLALLRQEPPLTSMRKVKVSRGEVYRSLAWAAVAAFNNAPLSATS